MRSTTRPNIITTNAITNTLKLPDTPEGHCQGTRGEWCGAYYLQVCVEGLSGGSTCD